MWKGVGYRAAMDSNWSFVTKGVFMETTSDLFKLHRVEICGAIDVSYFTC